ncbi:hypothetical protein BT96DRAFT_513503 [Gymnopus androsaceus JB14]|uniref:DNA 3'-5' helicase n=1 Tax=Gymnopus androsaceus JB14 TaxID=1447944 RepID=A0A6A4GM83_9AGAR|nr:hypothetical protein BT96DRAFT_513503 [Gymnopus androsaceus JB14]
MWIRLRYLLVSARKAGTDEFMDWVTCGTIRQRLMRIFIDEAHKILVDESFHPCFKLFYHLTSTSVPITFLSATLMPRSIPYLLEQMQIHDPTIVDEIRHYTGRKNLKYLMEKIDDDTDILPRIESLVNGQGVQLEGKERGIIFCQMIDDVNALCETLKSPVYHGDLDNEARDKATEVWRKGKSFSDRWMLCTHDQAFGQDINYPHVRITIHKNPRELINWVQETGQAGRDNIPAVCHTFWSALPHTLAPSNPDHSGREEMRRLLRSSECLRLGFAALDRETWSCAALDGELCSNCEKAALIPFHLSLANFPQINKPLVLSDPTNPSSKQIPITVQTNAAELCAERAASEQQLIEFKKILDSADAHGCLDCWVYGQQHMPDTNHQRHLAFEMHEGQLKISWSQNQNWLYCWHCWVPLHRPCNHPPIPEQPFDPTQCPYQVYDSEAPNPTLVPMVPHLIALIFGHTSKHPNKDAFEGALANDLGINPSQLTDISHLKRWLHEPVTKTQVHNFVCYIISWYKLTRPTH